MSEGPPLIVLEDPSILFDLRTELTAAGWHVRDGFPPLAEPWPLSEPRLVCVGPADTPEREQAALRCGARGAGLVILGTGHSPAFDDDLARLGMVTRYAAGSLSPRALALLRALARGVTLEQAAREASISEATGWRELRAARKVLGVRTNAQAIAEAIHRYGRA